MISVFAAVQQLAAEGLTESRSITSPKTGQIEAVGLACGVKVSELLRLLEQDGWTLVRQRGSHGIYRHPVKSGQVVVPVHGSKEVASGTLNSILKKAGLK